jgi:hypothetical protein
MRLLVRRRQYVMTTHADEEADADGFDIFDIESSLTTSMSCESGTASSRANPEPTSVGPSRARAWPSPSEIEPGVGQRA